MARLLPGVRAPYGSATCARARGRDGDIDTAGRSFRPDSKVVYEIEPFVL